MSYTNTDRAESITQPLALFAEAQGITDEDTRTQLHDLVSNAAHALAALGLDPATEFRRALDTYAEELEDENAEERRQRWVQHKLDEARTVEDQGPIT